MINNGILMVLGRVTQIVSQLIGVILLGGALSLICNSVFAQEQQKILVLNSNQAVKKYALTQQAFDAAQQRYISTVVDLFASNSSADDLVELVNKNQFKGIYCIGTKAYFMARQALPEQKIVFSSIMNWRRLPQLDNSFGIAQELPAGMQLMMYRYLFPELKKVGVLYSEQFNKEWLKDALQAGQDVGLEVIGRNVSLETDLNVAISQLLSEVDALWLIADPMVLADRAAVVNIFRQAENARKPVLTYSDIFLDFGATLIISADIPTMGGQVATLLDDVIANTIDSEKVRNPAGSHIVLNMKRIKRYAIKLNKEALGSVNKIIE